VRVERRLRSMAGSIDDRFGAAGFAKRAAKKASPDHWSLVLGEIALYSFIILLLTGVPDPVLQAEHDRGRLPRQLHPSGRRQDVRGVLFHARLYPVFMAKTAALFFFVFGVLAVFGAIAQINPIWLFGPYDPAISSNTSQPDWYIGFLEGALRLMPAWKTDFAGHTVMWNVFVAGVVLVLAFFLIMGCYPFLEQWATGDTRPHQVLDRPRNMPARTALGAAIVAMAADLQLASSASRPCEKARPTPRWPARHPARSGPSWRHGGPTSCSCRFPGTWCRCRPHAGYSPRCGPGSTISMSSPGSKRPAQVPRPGRTGRPVRQACATSEAIAHPGRTARPQGHGDESAASARPAPSTGPRSGRSCPSVPGPALFRRAIRAPIRTSTPLSLSSGALLIDAAPVSSHDGVNFQG
jgi:hypothetical protein